ncbi:hypothetical protein C8Q78DRAFT_418351 [Trametes maxima]|nr:hypothetical protein C8Q78DRAFT_418351 [Trametes maxima]
MRAPLLGDAAVHCRRSFQRRTTGGGAPASGGMGGRLLSRYAQHESWLHDVRWIVPEQNPVFCVASWTPFVGRPQHQRSALPLPQVKVQELVLEGFEGVGGGYDRCGPAWGQPPSALMRSIKPRTIDLTSRYHLLGTKLAPVRLPVKARGVQTSVSRQVVCLLYVVLHLIYPASPTRRPKRLPGRLHDRAARDASRVMSVAKRRI